MQTTCARDSSSTHRTISFYVVSHRNKKNQFYDEATRDPHRDIKRNSRFRRYHFHGGKWSGGFSKRDSNKKLAWADNVKLPG